MIVGIGQEFVRFGRLRLQGRRFLQPSQRGFGLLGEQQDLPFQEQRAIVLGIGLQHDFALRRRLSRATGLSIGICQQEAGFNLVWRLGQYDLEFGRRCCRIP